MSDLAILTTLFDEESTHLDGPLLVLGLFVSIQTPQIAVEPLVQ